MPAEPSAVITASQKLMFAVVVCTLLCLLFPVAAPLFLSLFVGVAVRESGLASFQSLLGETVLYGATFFLGLTLGILCEANTILEPVVVKLLLLGLMWAYLHHFCAGIRFLMLDLNKGTDLPAARKSSVAVLVVSLTLTVILGVKLW